MGEAGLELRLGCQESGQGDPRGKHERREVFKNSAWALTSFYPPLLVSYSFQFVLVFFHFPARSSSKAAVLNGRYDWMYLGGGKWGKILDDFHDDSGAVRWSSFSKALRLKWEKVCNLP